MNNIVGGLLAISPASIHRSTASQSRAQVQVALSASILANRSGSNGKHPYITLAATGLVSIGYVSHDAHSTPTKNETHALHRSELTRRVKSPQSPHLVCGCTCTMRNGTATCHESSMHWRGAPQPLTSKKVKSCSRAVPCHGGRVDTRYLHRSYCAIHDANSSPKVRYHHDGKYNVMALAGPIEIYGQFLPPIRRSHSFDCEVSVDKPSTLDFGSVRSALSRIVTLCLDSDPSLIPISCQGETGTATQEATSNDDEARDPDDFRFWSEIQAVRISKAIQQAFNVDLTPEVIIADANLSALTNRVLTAHELFSS